MHLSEVELNAALRTHLVARRQSHRGLMALALLIVLMFLYPLWLWALAWMVGIFLFLLPVGLGAVVGILSLDA